MWGVQTLYSRTSYKLCRAYSIYYTSSHEYIDVKKDEGTCGITNHAADKMGDIVYVALPHLSQLGEGEIVDKGESIAEIESVKTCEEIKSPVSGTITDINVSLGDNCELISTDSEGKGWMWKMTLNNKEELKDLMDKEGNKLLT